MDGNKVTYDSTVDGLPDPQAEGFSELVGSEFKVILDTDFKVKDVEGRDELLNKLKAANPQRVLAA